MNALGLCLLIASAIEVLALERTADIEALPRGVPYNRAALYKRSSEFLCLDGSKSILYSQVNDDYCDCPDGSDETGTSACPNGKFHCANKGHTAVDIPSSRVNDRICDCCDGSDEYSGAVQCSNICDELGQSAREERKRQAEIARKGFVARKALAAEGQKLRDEKIQTVGPLKAERENLVPSKNELETRKNTAVDKETALKDKHREAWEALRKEKKQEKSSLMFKEVDVNGDQKITLDELKKLEYLDTDHDGTISDDEAKAYLSVEEADIDHFLNNMYESLKSEKRAAEDYKREQQLKPDHDDLIADEDHEDITKEQSAEVTTTSKEDDDLDTMPPYDGETLKAMEEAEAARKEFDELNNKIIELDNQIREAESFIDQDYDTDFAWAALKGKCFDLNEKQYTYTLCMFERTTQKDKSGYGETGLGNWKEWSGLTERKYSKQSYKDGQQCWNGPQRSTEVEIQCGETSELVEATEPAKCEYYFVFRTPAACVDPDRDQSQHMEL